MSETPQQIGIMPPAAKAITRITAGGLIEFAAVSSENLEHWQQVTLALGGAGMALSGLTWGYIAVNNRLSRSETRTDQADSSEVV